MHMAVPVHIYTVMRASHLFSQFTAVMILINCHFLVGGKYWCCPLFAPFRGPEPNQNTDINAGNYHLLTVLLVSLLLVISLRCL